MSLDFVDSMLSDVATPSRKPEFVESVHYLFFTNGISYEEFKKLPLPYIFSILNTHAHNQEQIEKKRKK